MTGLRHPLRVADVFRLAGVKSAVPIDDEHVSTTCPTCDNRRDLDTCRLAPSQETGGISDYYCRRCDVRVAATRHPSPVPRADGGYRFGEYVVWFVADAILRIGGTSAELLIPADLATPSTPHNLTPFARKQAAG